MSNSTTYGANSLAQNSSFFSIFFAFFKPICYALISTSRARLKLRWNQREKLYIGVYRELRRVCSKRAEISRKNLSKQPSSRPRKIRNFFLHWVKKVS